jgi:undecaprenyl-diphosphatase
VVYSTEFWTAVSYLGDTEFWLGVAVASILIYRLMPKKARHYLNWQIFGVLPSVVTGATIVYAIKNLLKIPRPCEGITCPDGFSFPSGHATVIFASMTFLMLIDKSVKMRIFYGVMATLVSVSRIMLGVHRIEDIVVGSVIGISSALLVYYNHKNILHMARGIKL